LKGDLEDRTVEPGGDAYTPDDALLSSPAVSVHGREGSSYDALDD